MEASVKDRKEYRQKRGPEGHRPIAPWKQVGKTVKKTGRREGH